MERDEAGKVSVTKRRRDELDTLILRLVLVFRRYIVLEPIPKCFIELCDRILLTVPPCRVVDRSSMGRAVEDMADFACDLAQLGQRDIAGHRAARRFRRDRRLSSTIFATRQRGQDSVVDLGGVRHVNVQVFDAGRTSKRQG